MKFIETKKIKIGELEFDCLTAGHEKDELVILLHGFPETSIMWSQLMGKLASLGFYCIAPNMRGYSENACPKGVENYAVEYLRSDITNIADALHKYKFHLIGHDWGAAIGWDIVYHNPDKIISWTALSIPHNRAFKEALKANNEQKKKSYYVALFLLPFIPEFILKFNDFKRLKKIWKHCSSEEFENYLSVFRRKQTLTATLNYYRANFGKGKTKLIGDIETPTLFIWGNDDLAVSAFAAKSNHKYMKGDYRFLELDGGHWLMQTKYAEVEAAVIEQVSKYKSKSH